MRPPNGLNGSVRSVEPSSRGLTKRRSIQSLTMASRAMRLKNPNSAIDWEVSERRQVADTESMVNPEGGWWRNVGMEEGM